jgi:hypothetical protein
LDQIRDYLTTTFLKWTMPKEIRTDNGEPFGVPTRDVVPIMSAFLKGWGIKHILNPPRRPTDNAVVERGQGTTSRWAEVGKCRDINELQQRLDEACLFQREKYPVTRLGHITRGALHKSLWENPRPFDHTQFDSLAAQQLLGEARYSRRVSSSGTISLYGKSFSVGASNKGKAVLAKFNPAELAWTVSFSDTTLCKCIPDPRFGRENLMNLNCQ